MKKVLVLLILTAIVCSINTDTVLETPKETPEKVMQVCKDINTERKVLSEPTCTKEGKYIIRCEDCGNIVDSGDIPSAGHNFVDCVCTRKGCYQTNNIDDNSKTIILSSEDLKQFINGNTVTIPETYNGYKVVGIASGAFYKNTTIEYVNLPDTMTYIGMWAFSDCTNLKQINLENIQYFCYSCFQCCYSLENVDISSAKYIGNYAFNHLPGVDVESIEVPSTLECIGLDNLYSSHNFYDYSDNSFTSFTGGSDSCPVVDGILYSDNGKCLVSIPMGIPFKNNTFYMPDTVTSLGELSFSRNTNIKEVVISNNLTVTSDTYGAERSQYQNNGNELSLATYGYCPVEKYAVKEGNTRYTSVDGILYSKDLQRVIAIPNYYKGEIIIPEGVSVWKKNALWSNGVDYFKDKILNQISKVYIPASLTIIDSTQIETLNILHDYYGTSIEVSPNNAVYCVNSDGYLCSK